MLITVSELSDNNFLCMLLLLLFVVHSPDPSSLSIMLAGVVAVPVCRLVCEGRIRLQYHLFIYLFFW
jgi:hypothetical protein